jgi:hypothetical protein
MQVLKTGFILTFSLMQMALLAQADQNATPALELFKAFDHVRDISISEAHNEAFFTIQSPNQEISVIAFAKKQKKKWKAPEIMSFSGKFHDLEPFLTPNQLRLYFVSNRPLNETETTIKDYDIWYVERNSVSEEWSKPINLGSPVNTKYDEFYPTLSENNHLYFTSDRPNGMGKDDIYLSVWTTNSFAEPQIVEGNISSSGYEFNAFISPKEEFLVFTKYNAPDGFGSGDLYISRKNEKGEWQVAENLGATVNSKAMDYCPFYDAKTETLYFSSRRSAVEQKAFMNIQDLNKTLKQYENGYSKIYKIKIKL